MGQPCTNRGICISHETSILKSDNGVNFQKNKYGVVLAGLKICKKSFGISIDVQLQENQGGCPPRPRPLRPADEARS